MKYARMIMEKEAPNLLGYERFRYNLAESSVRDRSLDELGIDLGGMLLPYGHHYGHPGLRELIAGQAGDPVTADDVLVTVGAAGALFLLATCLLERGDHMVVAFPNYATNYETPAAIGCEVSRLEQRFDEGFRVDLDRLERLITPRTRYVSLTNPHNPSGVTFPDHELERIVALVERKGCYLLLDETYREMTYGAPPPVATTLSDRVVSVSSTSKMYGVPGIRVGWLTCRDRELMDHLIAAKEQVCITGSVVDEEIAYRILARHDTLAPRLRAEIREAFDLAREWMGGEPHLEWVEPQGGVICFPRIRRGLHAGMERFHRVLLDEYGTLVAPGRWFRMPEEYLRIGFAWHRRDETANALRAVSKTLAEVVDSDTP